MQHRHLGRTGLKVSPLCLGTMNFGPFTSEPDSFAIMDHALDAGINFFDTADVYGRQRGEGVTEQIIGRWFSQGGGRREHTVIATKVFGDMDRDGQPNLLMQRGLSAAKIIRACENSLKRMQTDRIDLYQMHHIDRACPWDEIFQAMETLIAHGKVIYIGSSNFAGWDIAAACQIARGNSLGLISEQSVYHLDNRTIELEVIPACRHYGLGLIPWSPLGGGILGGALQKSGQKTRTEEKQKLIEQKRPQLERYENLCRELGEPPASIALAWLLHNPTVTAPIIGPRTMEQLTSVLKVPDLKLSDETMKQLDAIWPGPGGEAPQAYAW